MALISHEGIVQSRYRDSKNVWTIGVGHTKAAGGLNPETFTGTLTVKEVMDLLEKDLAKYEADVNRALKVNVTQHQFDALVSFHYNTGAIARATLTKTLNAGDKKKAADQFMNWQKPPEIKGRRTAEMNLFKSGIYPPPVAMMYPASASGVVQWKQGKKVNLEDLLSSMGTKDTVQPSPEKDKIVIESAPPAETGSNVGEETIMSLLAKFLGKLFGGK